MTLEALDPLMYFGRDEPPDASARRRRAGPPQRRPLELLDMRELLARPPRPERNRIEGLARDGALTLICGAAGSGKSWLAMELCAAVQAGRSVAGIRTSAGPAVYIDAEMGAEQMTERYRAAGYDADAFYVVDARGFTLAETESMDVLRELLAYLAPKLVVLDSLRRLSPGRNENDSDHMAPLIADLGLLARELDTAIVLLHHMGYGDGHFARGSSAIVDQADALFGLTVESDGQLRLSCDIGKHGKYRFGHEPADRLLRRNVDGTGRTITKGDTVSLESDATAPATRAVEMAMRLPALVAAGYDTRKAIAQALGCAEYNQSLREAIELCLADKSLQRPEGTGTRFTTDRPRPDDDDDGAAGLETVTTVRSTHERAHRDASGAYDREGSVGP